MGEAPPPEAIEALYRELYHDDTPSAAANFAEFQTYLLSQMDVIRERSGCDEGQVPSGDRGRRREAEGETGSACAPVGAGRHLQWLETRPITVQTSTTAASGGAGWPRPCCSAPRHAAQLAQAVAAQRELVTLNAPKAPRPSTTSATCWSRRASRSRPRRPIGRRWRSIRAGPSHRSTSPCCWRPSSTARGPAPAQDDAREAPRPRLGALPAGHPAAGRRQPQPGADSSYREAFRLDPSLSDPRRNPHVLDNSLTTAAMLEAFALLAPASTSQRIYVEPSRITGLLLPSLTATPAEPMAGTAPETTPMEETAPSAPWRSRARAPWPRSRRTRRCEKRLRRLGLAQPAARPLACPAAPVPPPAGSARRSCRPAAGTSGRRPPPGCPAAAR